jgi:hypothetical protein
MLVLQRLEHNWHLLEFSLLIPFLTLAEERQESILQESIFTLIDAGLTFDLNNVH